MLHVKEPDLVRPDRETIRDFFNSIPEQYDFLNSFLSLGLDRVWRRQAVKRSIEGTEQSIIDLGVGTGKSLAAFLDAHRFEHAVGCDFSEEMLKEAERKLKGKAAFLACDFHALPFPVKTFDMATGSFILRSVQHMDQFLCEVKRVLKPGGKAVFLELTRPKNAAVRRLLFEPYVKWFVPFMGRLFSEHDRAYQFLSQSVLAFPEPETLAEELKAAGFAEISLTPLSFGVVTLIIGRLPRA